MTIGLMLLMLGVGTSAGSAALYLFVLGIGLRVGPAGARPRRPERGRLHDARSGHLGSDDVPRDRRIARGRHLVIFTSRLTSELRSLTGPLGRQVGERGTKLTGAQVARLPGPARSLYEHAYVNALAPVFLAAGGATAVGFALSWLLQEKPLRETAATSTGLDDSLAAPRSPDSLAEIERALARATGLELRDHFATRIAERADMGLSGAATWALVRIDEHGVLTARAMAEEDGVEAGGDRRDGGRASRERPDRGRGRDGRPRRRAHPRRARGGGQA